MVKRQLWCTALLLSSVILISVGTAGAAERQSSTGDVPDLRELAVPRSEMQSIIERYQSDRSTLMRSYTLPPPPVRVNPNASEAPERRSPNSGFARGGRGGDLAWMMSVTYRSRLKSFDTQWLTALDKLNFDALDQDGKVDFLLFRHYLDRDLKQIDRQTKQANAIEPLVPFASKILGLAEEQRRREFVAGEKAAATLTEITKQVEQARKAAEQLAPSRRDVRGEGSTAVTAPKVKREDAARAASVVAALRSTLGSWFGLYYAYDPQFTWWVTGPYRQLDQALASYGTLISGLAPADRRDARAITGTPVGRDELMAQLADEMIPYTPEELIAIAEKEFAWCEAEMKRASRDLGYGDDWKKALEYVKTKHVQPGDQPKLIRDLAYQAVEFLQKNDLITIPPLALEDWRIEMMSPERQLVNPFFTGGDMISVSFPTDSMTYEEKLMSMRGNNIPFAHATVFHELIPGHHLQGYMRARYRPYRGMFSTSFAGEGWALYWEMLMWDLGFDKTPEEKIGALFWRMHRCARIIFSLSFHLGRMTPQECVDMLVNQVGHERANAEAEVRRSFDGSYPPLYQAAYMLGALQLRELHKELVGSGKMTNREFHDAAIRQGSIPIEMMKVALTKQKVSRDYASNWKFYGPVKPAAGNTEAVGGGR